VHVVVPVPAGPSAVGRASLMQRLVAEYPDKFGLTVSHTSRRPREHEVHGRDYFFTDKATLRAGACPKEGSSCFCGAHKSMLDQQRVGGDSRLVGVASSQSSRRSQKPVSAPVVAPARYPCQSSTHAV
jgi:hypothetical protein